MNRKFPLAIFFLMASFSLLKAQSQYKSPGTGVTVDLSSPANWQVYSAGSWFAATTAPTGLASGSTILIQSGDTWANGTTASTIPVGVTLTIKSTSIGAFTAGKITMSGTMVYSGTATQLLPPSNAFSSSKLTNLTVNNLAGVQVGTGSYTIAGVLYVQAGVFNTNNGGNTFTLSGSIQSGGGTINCGSTTNLLGTKTIVNTDFLYSSVVGQVYRLNVGIAGSPGNISTTGAFTIFNNFNLTLGTLSLGGALSIKATGTSFTSASNAGSIVAGNNLVSFDGTAQQAVKAAGFFANNNVNNLAITNTASGGGVTYPTSLTIGNSLTIKLATGVTPLTVNGTATLGGTLTISGFASLPTPGQVYTILSGSAISGTFSSLILPTGYIGTLDYTTPNVVKLTVNLSTQSINDFSVIMGNIRAGFSGVADNTTAGYISSQNPNGSWSDINYADHSAGTWQPGTHWARISYYCRTYCLSGSSYYGSATLRQAIINAMNYWLGLNPVPSSTNWYYTAISLPSDIGTSLIAMRYGAIPLDATLEHSIIEWMKKGKALSQFTAVDGSNLTDVAQHYMMRACLAQDPALLTEAVTAVSNSLVIANNNGSGVGDGLQIDNSFTAHGPELYLYGYGAVFVSGITDIAGYIKETSFTFTADKIAILSNLVRNGLLKVTRGQYHDFNAFNRQISRPNEGKPGTSIFTNTKNIDLAQYSSAYTLAISRLNGTQVPSYQVAPGHIHFWRTDYTVHHRPKYMFGLRSVSTRTLKSENLNGENLKGYYVTEGANYIAVNGNEYYNIFPVWEWNKIPGTTVPEISTIPVRANYTEPGTASFVGGVSDGLYGVSTYAMNDYNTLAKKSWFFFDEEVICLGAGINSTATEAINTTVNQCLLDGTVNVRTSTGSQALAAGSVNQYSGSLNWVHHNSVGYFFPQGGNISLSNQAQTGTQFSINTNQSNASITKDVFKLWFQHGVSPLNGSYAYIVAPGKTLAEMDTYNAAQVQIWSNTSTLQAVYHTALDMLQVVFYQSGSLINNGITITVDTACALIIRNLSTTTMTVLASDPSQTLSTVNVSVSKTSTGDTNGYTAMLPTGLMAGSTVTAAMGSQQSTVLQKNVKNEVGQIATLNVKVFPNPSMDFFTVQLPTENNEKIQMSIRNMSGQVVKANIQFMENTAQVGQDLCAGIYFLQVKVGDKRAVIKLIKQ